MHTAIPLPIERIADFCKRWNIARLEVFGSVLRTDFGPESDVDFLVTYAPQSGMTYFRLVDAERELTELIGRRADLVSRRAIERSKNPYRREPILASAQLLYAA